MNQVRHKRSFGEVMKARAARKASTAYSLKWPALRTSVWTRLILLRVICGFNQRSNGSSQALVFAAENSLVEAMKITASQMTSGAKREKLFGRVVRRAGGSKLSSIMVMVKNKGKQF